MSGGEQSAQKALPPSDVKPVAPQAKKALPPESLAWSDILQSVWRGFRNAVIAGYRIRLPYIVNALVLAALSREKKYIIVVWRFVVSQNLL